MSNHAVQLVDEITSASKELEEWVVSIEAPLDDQFSDPTKSLQPSTDSNGEEKPSIFYLYQCDVSIGCMSGIHGSSNSLWPFVAFMKRWFGLNVRSFLEDIQEKEHLILGYYLDSYDSYWSKVENGKLFQQYLLVKSCFIVIQILFLQTVCNAIGTKEKSTDPRDKRSIELYILCQYMMEDPIQAKCQMLFMTNQIPWLVVEAVYTKHSNLSKLFGTSIHILAISCFDDLYPRMHKSKVHGGSDTLPPGGFKHLLHIFHWTRAPKGKFEIINDWEPLQPVENFYIPSATELQTSAIVFEKHAGGSIDVSYCDRRLSGVMQLAPLHLFKYNMQIYASLLQFEQLYKRCGLPVTAYVACMVCMLQSKKDVRLLRANGIVPSTRNDENDVLQCVESFKTSISCVVVPQNLYALSKKVNAHHERSSSRYYADFKSRYCANPWVTISIIAGVCLFLLTFIQAIIQAVFGALSYYKH